MSKKTQWELMKMFEDHLAAVEAAELREFAMDTLDVYDNEEIAQMVREGVLTIGDVETGLRRRMYG